MAEKAPPQPPPDQNVLVYVSEYQNVALQTSINSRKPSYYRNFDSVSEQVSETVTVESLCTSTCSDSIDNDQSDYKPDSISPPFGWKRLLSNGIIIYVSPSNTALSSLDQVRSYVESEGTCKCGLECPLHLHSAFNFDPKVITKPCAPPMIGPGDLTKLCNHKRKLLTSLENVHGDIRYGDGLMRKKKRRMVLSLGSATTLTNVPAPPVQTTLTPPPARTDNPPFLKVHQSSLPSNPEVWREDVFANGYVEFPDNNSPILPSQSVLQDSGMISSQSASTILGPPSGLCNGPVAPPPSLQPVPASPFDSPNPLSLPPPVPHAHLPAGNNPAINIQPPAGVNSVIHSQTQANIQQQGVPGVLGSSLPHGTVRRFPPSGVTQSTCPPSHVSSYQQQLPQQVQYDNRTLASGFTVKYGTKGSSGSVQQLSIANQLQTINSHIQTVPTNFQQSNQQNLNSQAQAISNQSQMLTSHQINNQQMLSTPQNLGNVLQNVSGSPQNYHHQQQQSLTSTFQNINNSQVSGLLPGSNCQQVNLPQNQNNLSSIPNPQETPKPHQAPAVHHECPVSNVSRVRTPPWHQNKQQSSERAIWTKKSKPNKEESPSFLEDPTGYLAQQTALLRQAVSGTEDEEPRTMASSHTASSNTLTSVLAGRTNTLTVSVGSQEPVKPQHFLVSGNGQFIIAAAPKVSPPSPLLLPAPLLLQPIDTVQLPQLVVPPVIHEEHIEKRKSPNKKRKLSPTTSTAMLLSPQPQQQVLTILPSKSPITNMIQPLNVVQNFPIQQFLVPSMVMSDGTILQDAVQVNLLPSTGVFSSGQNLLAPAGVVLRAPTSQPQPQQTKFLHSPNQFVGFSGELSPVVPNTSNTTVVQQNTTTIVQQTTMVQQPSPSYILDKPNFILTSDKHNLILSPGSEKVKNSGFVRNSVSTQTQNQVVQVSSSGGLVVTTGGSRGGSPPDTTTLSPADQEVTTSVTSPDPSMVHCVSSTNLQDDTSPYHIDTTTSIPYSSGNLGKSISYAESSIVQPLQDKDITQLSSDDYSSKLGLCSTTSDSSHLGSLHDSE